MKTIIKGIAAILLVGFTLVSCNGEQSLQEYYVDNQGNSDFILVDVPTSLISEDSEVLDDEQRKILKTLRKINIMAYPLKESSKVNFEAEKIKVTTILASDDYEELMKVSSDQGNMKLYFRGEEDAIDEVIVFASEDSKGFMLARLLGNDMNISDMMKLADAVGKGDVDVSQFEGVMDVFKDN